MIMRSTTDCRWMHEYFAPERIAMDPMDVNFTRRRLLAALGLNRSPRSAAPASAVAHDIRLHVVLLLRLPSSRPTSSFISTSSASTDIVAFSTSAYATAYSMSTSPPPPPTFASTHQDPPSPPPHPASPPATRTALRPACKPPTAAQAQYSSRLPVFVLRVEDELVVDARMYPRQLAMTWHEHGQEWTRSRSES
ncbi:hypothetical protein MSAN_01705800 [Mycena sanguinolenta]|uniref:Uncharacterized protein n=1 Tax=Mycena sanguinolenta TaxID=230812 RepID=A0A8H6Y073_9AGAR|nr:hypothetical protein MSAN_01705800 [Mycena sanguinolenta]